MMNFNFIMSLFKYYLTLHETDKINKIENILYLYVSLIKYEFFDMAVLLYINLNYIINFRFAKKTKSNAR